jgi:hypothetical protein
MNIIELPLIEDELQNNQEIENSENNNINIKKTYTISHKLAQQRYRHKNPEAYCQRQRDLYNRLKDDDEWRLKFNERSKINNAKYREKKKEEKLNDPNYVRKIRGRPRKF